MIYQLYLVNYPPQYICKDSGSLNSISRSEQENSNPKVAPRVGHSKAAMNKATLSAQGNTPNSDAVPKCFEDLPPEILLDISDRLFTVDAASFALCNRRLAKSSSQESWEKLRNESSELHAFIKLLAKDHPQFFACNICHKLHLVNKIAWPNTYPLRQTGECIYYCPKIDDDPWHYPKDFLQLKDKSLFMIGLNHVQLAISGHMPLEAFRHTEVDDK